MMRLIYLSVVATLVLGAQQARATDEAGKVNMLIKCYAHVDLQRSSCRGQQSPMELLHADCSVFV